MCVLFLSATCSSRAPTARPQDIFDPKRITMSMPEIATYASTSSPSWPTFSGRSMCKVVSDMCLLDHCHRSPTGFTLGDQAALALFMNRCLLVRKQGEPGEHFFVVGQMYYVSILVPAVDVLVDGNNGLKGFSIAEISKANLVFQVVLDLDDWEATPIEWATPLILSHRLGRAPCFKGVVALPTGPAENLLKAAARHCFWSVIGGALDLALDHLGMRKPPKIYLTRSWRSCRSCSGLCPMRSC